MTQNTITWIGARDKYNNGDFIIIGSGSQVPQAMWYNGAEPQDGHCASVFASHQWLLNFDCETSLHYVCEAFLDQ